MIELIHINEYVYLKDVDIYLSEGLNVITGETGTGKSLILDVIGSFLDYQNIRSETFSADMVVNLRMDCDELGIKKGQHVFSVERKNKRLFYKIDGRLVSREQVQNVLSSLITIHKQNSHMKLLDKDFILEILDEIAGNSKKLENYKKLYDEYQQVFRIITTTDKATELKKLEELKERVSEIANANLSEDEEQELEEKYKRALNMQTLLQNYSTASQQLEEIEYALRRVYSLLEDKHHDLLDNAVESIAELNNRIGKELAKIEDINLEEIENRLWVYKKLRRKYGPTTEDVLANFKKWSEEIRIVEKTIEILENAERERQRLESELRDLALQISEKRKGAARKIIGRVQTHEETKSLELLNKIETYETDTHKVIYYERRLDEKILSIEMFYQTLPKYATARCLENIATVILNFIDRVYYVQKLEEASFKDPLTKLFNRRYFVMMLQAEIRRIKRYGGDSCVVMIDLDGLKQINDTYGHDKGDLAITTLAQVMIENTRNTDVCARFGGDEFAILLPNTPPEFANLIIQRIIDKLDTLDIKEFRISISAGITKIQPSDDAEGISVLKRADELLYKAKRSGKHTICIDATEE